MVGRLSHFPHGVCMFVCISVQVPRIRVSDNKENCVQPDIRRWRRSNERVRFAWPVHHEIVGSVQKPTPMSIRMFSIIMFIYCAIIHGRLCTSLQYFGHRYSVGVRVFVYFVLILLLMHGSIMHTWYTCMRCQQGGMPKMYIIPQFRFFNADTMLITGLYINVVLHLEHQLSSAIVFRNFQAKRSPSASARERERARYRFGAAHGECVQNAIGSMATWPILHCLMMQLQCTFAST